MEPVRNEEPRKIVTDEMAHPEGNRAKRRRAEKAARRQKTKLSTAASEKALKDLHISQAELRGLLSIEYDQRINMILAELNKHDATELEKRQMIALYQKAGIL